MTTEGGKTEEREDGRRKAIEAKTGLEVDGGASAVVLNVPLEFVREVARASAVAEAAHVEGSPIARHGCCRAVEFWEIQSQARARLWMELRVNFPRNTMGVWNGRE